jgi:hypothetical protein
MGREVGRRSSRIAGGNAHKARISAWRRARSRQSAEGGWKHIMKKILTMLAAVAAFAFGGSVCRAEEAAAGDAEAAKEHAAAAVHTVYVCPDCHTVALSAGNCAGCGKELEKAHLLGVKDGKATLCGCGANCKCDAAGVEGGKCSCGKDVKEASLKGLYACPAGCPVVSDQPGKCGGCGKEMVKAE